MNPNRPRNAGKCCEPDLMPSESQSRGKGRSWETRRCPPPPLGDFNASIFFLLAFPATSSSSKTEEEAKPIEDAFIVWFVIRWRGLRCCCSDSLILLLLLPFLLLLLRFGTRACGGAGALYLKNTRERASLDAKETRTLLFRVLHHELKP